MSTVWEVVDQATGEIVAITNHPLEADEWRGQVAAGEWGPGLKVVEVTL